MMRIPPFTGASAFEQIRDNFAAHLLPAVYESFAIDDRNDRLPSITPEEFRRRIAEEVWLLADAMVQERERRIKEEV